jgi:hypothetical protein
VEGFAEAQSNEGTETGFSEFPEPDEGFAEPQNRSETGEAAGFSQFPQSGEGFAEVAEPVKSDTQRDRARARVKRTATRNPDVHRCRG